MTLLSRSRIRNDSCDAVELRLGQTPRLAAEQGGNGLLGGDPGDMVVVRLRYAPGTPLAGLREMFQAGESDSLAFRALAVARNEGAAGVPQPPAENLQVSGR